MKEKLSHRERVLKQAGICIKRGQKVVPIPHGQKGPRLQGWQNLCLAARDLPEAFGPSDGLGLILGGPSGNLIDIDLDAAEAVLAAPFFLPLTDRIHGRPGKKSSHFWYITDPLLAPRKFLDSDGTSLVELRSTNQQTLIPPSRHPSGERLRWEKIGQAAEVTADALSGAVCRLAACALIARHWPQKGSRHEVTMALTGLLLRNGWSEEAAKNFVTAVAFASGRDEEWRTRERDVSSTVERLSKNQTATGIPRLAALLGEDVVSKLTDWLGISSQTVGVGTDHTSVPSWPEQPRAAAFEGLAGEVVGMIEPHSEADPVALLSQFLVGFGSAIGKTAYFQVEADKHFANLFAVLVGATSKGRKGSALSQIKRPLVEADSNWANTCILSGLSSGEGLIWAVRDPIYSKDGEKVIDAGVADKRLLVVEPEFAQPLKLMARETNILSTGIRQAWDSGNLRTLTKHSPTQATGAHISIIGHITQHELRRYLAETELGNGFGNRFLWLAVRRSKSLPDGGHLRNEDVSLMGARVSSTISWLKKPKKLKRGAGTQKLWREVYPVLSEGTAGLLGAVTSRAEAQVTRLAMLYAVLDRSPLIQRKHLESALALWDYAQASARFVFGDSLGDPTADEILRALRASPGGLTRTDISNVFGGHRRSADIARALVVLAQNGLASCRSESTGGRPDERWSVLADGANYAK